MTISDVELMGLVDSCARGDRDAKISFQDLFGEYIYNYPIAIFGLARDKAADFYIYAFERDRIFNRVKGFEARNNSHFKTYLSHYVLRDLFFEWQRTQKELQVVSLETPVRESGSDSGLLLGDVLSSSMETDDLMVTGKSHETSGPAGFMEKLDREKKAVLKLLYLPEFDLDPEDVRFLCRKSARTYSELLAGVEEIRNLSRRRDEQVNSLLDQLDSIFGWILVYQRDIAKISEDLKSRRLESTAHDKLQRDKEELERKLEWRYRQRNQVLEKLHKFRMTVPYKDIARLLNVPIGTVCSLIARIRAEISENLGDRKASV